MDLIVLLVGYSYITSIGVRVEQLRQLHFYGVRNRKQERIVGYGCGYMLQLLRRPWLVSSICVRLRYSSLKNKPTGRFSPQRMECFETRRVFIVVPPRFDFVDDEYVVT